MGVTYRWVRWNIDRVNQFAAEGFVVIAVTPIPTDGVPEGQVPVLWTLMKDDDHDGRKKLLDAMKIASAIR
jgi:hypothetical protein